MAVDSRDSGEAADGIDAADVSPDSADIPDVAVEGDGDVPDPGEDVPDESSIPDSWDVVEVVVPEDQERFFTPITGEIVNLHRSAMPVAYSGAVYGLLLEAVATPGTPGPLAAYILDPEAGTLTRAWIDDAPGRTEDNSICWSGTVFVVALPTPSAGVRLLAFGTDGAIVSGPAILEPDPAYTPASEGYPPVLVCPASGPLFLDRNRTAGGGDRVYPLAADGTYPGAHVDVDLPDVITNMYLATSPCVGTSAWASCATDAGLVFVDAAGTVLPSDAVGALPPCTDVYGCDVSWDGTELVVAGAPLAGSIRELRFARFTGTGGLILPTVIVPDSAVGDGYGVRVASSGDALAILTGASDSGMSGVSATLHVLHAGGMWLAPPMAVAACLSPGGSCSAHLYGGGAAILWDGTQFVALWVTNPEPAVAVRAFRVVP